MSIATRALPGTDLRISEIGFGCGGNAGLMLRGTEAEQIHTVARALELGITYFDTAPDYGAGEAERALGRALRALGGPAPIITTKVEIRAENLDDIAGHVVRSAESSLRRLGLDRIDILQIHNGPTPTPPPMADGDYHHLWTRHFLGPNGAAEGLRRLIASGTIAHAGFVSRGNDRDACDELLQTGQFRLINLSYNLLDPQGAQTLALAARHECGTAVFSPLAGGLLAGPGPRHSLARPGDAPRRRHAGRQALAEALQAELRAYGDPVALAWRFALAPEQVTTVIGGFSSVEQVESVAALSGQGPLPAPLLAALQRRRDATTD